MLFVLVCALRRRRAALTVCFVVCALLDRLALTGKCLLVVVRAVTSESQKPVQQWYEGGPCKLLATVGFQRVRTKAWRKICEN